MMDGQREQSSFSVRSFPRNEPGIDQTFGPLL